MAHIIIRGKTKYARSMTELESNLRKDGKSIYTDEQFDKCKHAERRAKEIFGMKGCFFDHKQIDSIQ